jgi:antitoxin (DNA-binding transcriptional repressor) of toxin-antitoxin stability system
MTVYTFSEARQNFASLLEKVKKEGKVLIKRKDGSIFEVLPITPKGSPLDVKGIDVSVDAAEIVSILHEVRER